MATRGGPRADITLDQPNGMEAQGKTVTTNWKYIWTLEFDQPMEIPHPLTQAEFVAMAKEQIEWMKAEFLKQLDLEQIKQDFLKQLEKYPPELLKTLDQYEMVRRETFKQNGRG